MGRRYGSISSPGDSSPRAASRSSSSRMGSPASPPIPRSSKRPLPAAPITIRSLKAARRPGRLRCHGALRAARDRGHSARRRRAAPGLRRDRAPGWICQPRSVALSGDEHRGDDRRGAAALAGGRPRQPDDQGAGDEGRPAGDPPAHRRGHQRQHHAVVLAAGL